MGKADEDHAALRKDMGVQGIASGIAGGVALQYWCTAVIANERADSGPSKRAGTCPGSRR